MEAEEEEKKAEREAEWTVGVAAAAGGLRVRVQREVGWGRFQSRSWPLKGNPQLVVLSCTRSGQGCRCAGCLVCTSWGKTQHLFPPSPGFLLLHTERLL